MSTNDTRFLTHLDLPNRYAQYEQEFDGDLYKRFTQSDPCLLHVQRLTTISEIRVHFYLPDSASNHIPEPINGTNDTRIHPYCHDEDSLRTNKASYPGNAIYKIFLENSLKFYIDYSQIELMYQLKCQHSQGSLEENQWANLGRRHISSSRNLFQQHIDAQLSEEAQD